MAIDIQFSYPQQLVQVVSVTLQEGTVLPTVVVIGEDFSSVDTVLLNDITSPEVVVLSKTMLTAVIPESVRGGSAVEVVVVSYRSVYTDGSIVGFRLGTVNRRVSGIQRLVQLFLKKLLTDPGSDIFNPTSGGGALRNLGSTFSKGAAGGVVGDLVIAVDATTRQVVLSQSRKLRLPREERLLSARVVGSRFDVAQTALIATVQITNQAGATATANLVM